jgi:hypothetical protein
VQLPARQFLRRSQVFIASLLSGIVLLVNAMAACPSLHELLHADAGQVGHQCAVTMFTHGQVDSTSFDVPVVAPLPVIQTVSFAYSSVFCPAIQYLPAGRAPPVGSSNS